MEAGRRVLVIAGTHQRENEYSHGVANALLSRYGAMSKPDETFYGIDGARRGDLWNLDNLSVGKIHKTGETSRGYLESLSCEERRFLEEASRKSGIEMAEIFEHYHKPDLHEWTSVSDSLIRATDPLYFIDLHSYHEATKGMPGNVLWISSHTDGLPREIVRDAFESAQEAESYIYGNPGVNLYSKEAIINAINDIRPRSGIPKKDHKKQRQSALEYIATNANDHWHFSRNGPCRRVNYPHFIFEAVKWGQPEITADFIAKYLMNSQHK